MPVDLGTRAGIDGGQRGRGRDRRWRRDHDRLGTWGGDDGEDERAGDDEATDEAPGRPVIEIVWTEAWACHEDLQDQAGNIRRAPPQDACHVHG